MIDWPLTPLGDERGDLRRIPHRSASCATAGGTGGGGQSDMCRAADPRSARTCELTGMCSVREALSLPIRYSPSRAANPSAEWPIDRFRWGMGVGIGVIPEWAANVGRRALDQVLFLRRLSSSPLPLVAAGERDADQALTMECGIAGSSPVGPLGPRRTRRLRAMSISTRPAVNCA